MVKISIIIYIHSEILGKVKTELYVIMGEKEKGTIWVVEFELSAWCYTKWEQNNWTFTIETPVMHNKEGTILSTAILT